MTVETFGAGVSVTLEGRVAVVRLAGTDKANALSVEVLRSLLAVARGFEGDAALSAVVLTGTAERFTLGFDLRDAAAAASLSLAERRELLALGPRLCAAWEAVEAFTVAAIEGWCVGGGVALAAALDLRVAGDGAHIYVPEVERGMNMSWGSVPRIVSLVGPARAKQMILLAQSLDAAQAEAWGFVQVCVPRGQALDHALTLARRAASMPPVALRMAKAGVQAHANALASATAGLDRDQFLLAQTSEDFAESVDAFLNHRTPVFRGA